MSERVIVSDACVAEGAAWLAARDPHFALAVSEIEIIPLRLAPEGFGGLLKIIMGQQVSVASARAIWTRLVEAGLTSQEAVEAAGEADLLAAGLSRQKTRYAKALAAADLDYAALQSMPTPEVIARLTAIKGIGPWTGQIYAKFHLGRADVFAAGDLALQEGARMLFDLPERPDAKAIAAMAENWSPWRSVAARILWAYYAMRKSRDGIA